jgi:hypothetical protein
MEITGKEGTIKERNGREAKGKSFRSKEILNQFFLQELPVVIIDTPIHNPFPPIQVPTGPSIERPVCSFYLKTGVCRYNERFVVSLSLVS